MAKNRKALPAGVRFGPVIKVALGCLFIGGAAVGFVWQKERVHALGKEIASSEIALAALQRENKVRADQLAYLMSPPALELRVKQLNLGLAQPPLAQIVRMVETPVVSSPVPPAVASPAPVLAQAAP